MPDPAEAAEVVRLEAVTRVHGSPPVHALAGVDLVVRAGEMVGVVGPSGSGKSTLLNVLGTLDRPTTGRVHLDGVDVSTLPDSRLSALRAHRIGFVFQQFHLQDGADAVSNVADGLLYSGTPRRLRRERARQVLQAVGLGHRLTHRPPQMSGGERQRVAIARAVIGNPSVLLADEPTGNLDSRSGAGVLEVLRALNARGATVVVITHDAAVAAQLPRRVRLTDGRIVHDSAFDDDRGQSLDRGDGT